MLNFINTNYVAVPCEEVQRCKAFTLHGQCTNNADWQIKKRSRWTPVCYIHLRKLIIGYRKSESTEKCAVKVQRIQSWSWLLWPSALLIWQTLQQLTDIYS